MVPAPLALALAGHRHTSMLLVREERKFSGTISGVCRHFTPNSTSSSESGYNRSPNVPHADAGPGSGRDSGPSVS